MDLESQPFKIGEAIFYAAVYLVGFFAGISKTLYDRDRVSCRYAFNIGCMAGFLSFAIVSFVDGHIDDRNSDPFFYLALAVIVGASVKKQDVIIRGIWKAAVEKFGLSGLADELDRLPEGPCPIPPRNTCDSSEEHDSSPHSPTLHSDDVFDVRYPEEPGSESPDRRGGGTSSESEETEEGSAES